MPPIAPQLFEGKFDDIDAMASSAIEWDQKYEQIGCGKFEGHLTQLVLNSVQLGRARWSPGVLQSGAAPKGSWAFALPIAAEGTLHVRRRPVSPGELLVATSRDDVGFVATGKTDLMVVVLPTPLIEHWVRARRAIDKLDIDLPSPRWQVTPVELNERAHALRSLLNTLIGTPDDYVSERALSHVESQIFDVILDMIPSAEVIEPLHNRARIARAVLALLKERLNDPPSVTELCAAVGARERTLYLSCVEAFGRPPALLLAELRLNAAHRALMRPEKETTVTAVAASYGFNHFGRFAAAYQRHFGELPSTTFAKAREETRGA